MENEFSLLELRLIQGMIAKRSYQEIADIIERPVEEVKEVIMNFTKGKSICTRQNKLDDIAAKRASRKNNKILNIQRDQAEKKELKRIQLARESEMHQRRRRVIEPLFKNKIIDQSKMMSVRIDRKTVLQLPLGCDIEAAKENYRNRIKKIEPILSANKQLKNLKLL